MQSRYSIRNETQFIQWPFTTKGYEQARKFRASDARFKGRRIRGIIQAYPALVPCGVVHTFREVVDSEVTASSKSKEASATDLSAEWREYDFKTMVRDEENDSCP